MLQGGKGRGNRCLGPGGPRSPVAGRRSLGSLVPWSLGPLVPGSAGDRIERVAAGAERVFLTDAKEQQTTGQLSNRGGFKGKRRKRPRTRARDGFRPGDLDRPTRPAASLGCARAVSTTYRCRSSAAIKWPTFLLSAGCSVLEQRGVGGFEAMYFVTGERCRFLGRRRAAADCDEGSDEARNTLDRSGVAGLKVERGW